jgi:hypothetical protein
MSFGQQAVRGHVRTIDEKPAGPVGQAMLQFVERFVGIKVEAVGSLKVHGEVIAADNVHPVGKTEKPDRVRCRPAEVRIGLDAHGPGEKAGDAGHESVAASQVHQIVGLLQPQLSEEIVDMSNPRGRPSPPGCDSIRSLARLFQ